MIRISGQEAILFLHLFIRYFLEFCFSVKSFFRYIIGHVGVLHHVRESPLSTLQFCISPSKIPFKCTFNFTDRSIGVIQFLLQE